MATEINTYQCPACIGPLHFSAGSGKLECEYCGSSYEVAEVEAWAENLDWSSILQRLVAAGVPLGAMGSLE